jgi:ribose transport system substrate-binding protein
MIEDRNRPDGSRGWSRREFLRTAAGLAIAVLLPGCDRGGPATPTAPAATGLVNTERYRRDPPWRVGRAGRGDLSSWQIMVSAHIQYGVTEKYSQSFAGYRFTVANWDADKQLLDIRRLLDGGIDVLLIDPLEAPAVAEGVDQAMAAGVPVILVSSGAPNAPYVSWVTTDEQERGTLCAGWLCRRASSGRVIVLQSTPTPGDNSLWLQGVHDGLAASPGLDVQVVSSFWQPSAARQAMAAALDESPSVQGLVVNGGTVGQGALEALSERGIAIPPVAGVDDCNGWLRAVAGRDVRYLGFGGSTRLGLRCVELAMDVLSGRPVPAYQQFPYEVFDETAAAHYYRSDLSDHFWAIHDLPESWLERMFKT